MYTHRITHNRHSATYIRDNGDGTITYVLRCCYPVGDNRGNNNWGKGPSTIEGTIEEFSRGYFDPCEKIR